MIFKLLSYKIIVIMLFITIISACGSSTDEPEPTTKNIAPVASAGADQQVNEQTNVTLTGMATDADGTITSYSWQQTSGTSVTLNNADTSSSNFDAPDVTQNETLSFTLTVTDNDGASHSDLVEIAVLKVNIRPVANAGDNQDVVTGSTVNLDGSASNDADNDTLTYQWTLVKPETSNAQLTNATMADASFVADIAGTYTASLIVNDGEDQSSASSVVITAVDGNSVSAQINGSIVAFNSSAKTTTIAKDQITITINLLDQNDVIVATATPAVAENKAAGTELRFNSKLTGSNASMVSIDVSSPGFTSSSRRVPLKALINIDAKLQQVTEKIVTNSTNTSISGEVTNGFNFQLSDNINGQQVDTMRISIPSSLLPQDTENLSMKVATYDPNNPEDAEFFPGEYQDSNGQKLVSVAFNFAEITTNTDEPVAQAMQRQRQQRLKSLQQKIGSANAEMLDEEPVIINRVIPIASCPILETMGDSDTTMAGFQVPIYVYNPNSGLWVLIGQGTIFDNDGI